MFLQGFKKQIFAVLIIGLSILKLILFARQIKMQIDT